MEENCKGCHTDVTTIPTTVKDRVKKKSTHIGGTKTTAMVRIPGGPFIIGFDNRHPDEKPAHTISIRTFFIDLYEVTNEQYKKFIDATNRHPPDDWIGGQYRIEKKNHPVVYVDWYDAHDYCAWAGKRLPTEEEWEKAARGTDGRLYPWGNEFDPKKANTPQSHSIGTTPVGSFPLGRSPYGVYDMSGNVWEWTDSWAKPYPGSPIPTGHYFTGDYKVLKGGSWVDCSFYRCGISALTFNRGYFKPLTKNQGFGFRCAKDG
jgi:formylglycine-generating enzyme required for sulfatase activity